jgi:sulfate adenylyltransferase
MQHLIGPYHGDLVSLQASDERVDTLKAASRDWPSWDLTPHQVADLELLMNGGMSPLSGFMPQSEVDAVCRDLRLTDGTLWPVPVTLDVSEAVGGSLSEGDQLVLRDAEGVMLAVMTVADLARPDLGPEVEALFGTQDASDARVSAYLAARGPVRVAGPVEGVQPPLHYDFREIRLTPAELRRKFARLGWRRVLAYQTHRTVHRAEKELAQRTALELGANLLVHPVVGLSRVEDADHYAKVRCHQALMAHFPKDFARLSLLPMASRGAGAREALWQAIVHRNHGCTHMLVEPNHGGTVLASSGAPQYDADEARELVNAHREATGVEMVPWQEMVYLEHRRRFVTVDEVPEDGVVRRVRTDEVLSRLDDGRPLPEWYTYPSVEKELRHRHPYRGRQGFTVFFTGLSGSGKSTIANALRVKLLEIGGRGVTLLDGDLVRKNLSSELGFSKEHRDLNIRRIGFVASEITRAGGAAICAPIAPYDSVRREVRGMVQPTGGFVLVHVSTPLEMCEARDRKGLYAKARAGIIKEFTGISDPYEAPADADVVIDTSDVTPEEAVREVLLHLEREGYVTSDAP